MKRERAIEEFEAIFEQAAIPVLDIEEVSLDHVSAVLKGTPLDASILMLADDFRNRFESTVHVHWPDAGRPDLDAARSAGYTIVESPFESTAALVGQVSVARSQLVLLPEPTDESRRFVDLDTMVQGARPPVLIIRSPISDPAKVFERILHSLTGDFRQTSNFAYSFTLAAERGALLLLHTIDAEDLSAVRDALRLAPNIEQKNEDDLLEHMTHHGERYLKGVVAASREASYDVRYRLAVGRVMATVEDELDRAPYGLLVLGHHRGGHSFVEAADYQLMHTVRDIPILAL